MLLSIQTQLLVKEPYFNEPGYDRTRGTRQGDESSARYNNNLRLATLRHAIVGPLRNPPKGLEEVTKRHFGMCRQRILLQAKIWTMEARNTPLYSRFARVYKELLLLLTDNSLHESNCLLPSPNDVDKVSMADPSLREEFESIAQASRSRDSKMMSCDVTTQSLGPPDGGNMTNATSANIDPTTYNPWLVATANHSFTTSLSQGGDQNGAADTSDDDFYV